MPGAKLPKLCPISILVTLIVQVLTVTSTAPLLSIQLINSSTRVIRYEPTSYIQQPLWCIDKFRANSDHFGRGIFQAEGKNLTYTNPSSSNVANNKLLYLVRDNDNNDCSNITDAVEISSDVGDISSAIFILLQVEAILCPELPLLTNGRVNTTIEEDEIHIAVYSCDAGYYLDSNETRECEREIGQWTSSPPACISITCEVPTLANGIVTNSTCNSDELRTNGTVLYGTEITYRCNAGFSLFGDYLTRTCRQSNYSNSGVWSGTTPYCKPNTCSQLSEVSYGLITEYWDSNDTALNSSNQTTFSVGTITSYSCQRGYKLSGNKAKKCLLNGEWSPGSVECKVIECPHLEKPLNGSISFNSSNLRVDGVATYDCDYGYKLDRGSNQRTCSLGDDDTMATWDGYPPVCTLNETLSSGMLSQVSNETVNNGTCCEKPHPEEVIWKAVLIVGVLLLFGIVGLVVLIICVWKSRHTKDYPIDNSGKAITQVFCQEVVVNNTELQESNADNNY